MTVALGASAYGAAIFHLMTHAFFKALLFLAAGSVIIALHHEQDMRRMGGLAKYMPVTAVTCWLGALALVGTPFFAGFYSKDAIIEAVHASNVPGHSYAAFAVTIGVFITAFYSFRMLFLAFHGTERFDVHGAHQDHAGAHAHAPVTSAQRAAHADPHDTAHADMPPGTAHETHEEPDPEHGHGGPPRESPWVVTVPLVLLAIPSVLVGFLTVQPVLFGGYFGNAIVVSDAHPAMAAVREEWHGVVPFTLHGFASLPFWLAVAGIVGAWYLYLVRVDLPDRIVAHAKNLYALLANNYYIDRFNDWFFAGGFRRLGSFFSVVGDRTLIDGAVNGTARLVGFGADELRKIQRGYVYWYAFAMVIGVAVLLFWYIPR
jgi:NADH-quinone oxidoreductase subunit L